MSSCHFLTRVFSELSHWAGRMNGYVSLSVIASTGLREGVFADCGKLPSEDWTQPFPCTSHRACLPYAAIVEFTPVCMLRGFRTIMRLRSHLHAGSSSAARLGPPAAVSRQLLRIQTNRSVNASFNTSSFAREAFLHRSCSHVCAAAVSSNDKPTQPEDYQQVSGLRLAQLLKIRLPSYCSGCGVKLQQEDPDGPG